MQLNFAKKWIRAEIGLWSQDPVHRTAVLSRLAEEPYFTRSDGGASLQPPGRLSVPVSPVTGDVGVVCVLEMRPDEEWFVLRAGPDRLHHLFRQRPSVRVMESLAFAA